MRRLYFGGAFNPIHYGHLICARAAAEADGFTQVALVPTANPPHKRATADLADAADRVEMLQLAVANDPLFTLDPIELGLSGPSYTINTVQALKERGETDVHWLIGADMLMYLPKWHRAEELLGQVKFVVMARPGWSMDWGVLPAAFRELRGNVITTPLIDITATDIRARIAAGKSIRYFTPQVVCDFISRRKLYQRRASDGVPV